MDTSACPEQINWYAGHTYAFYSVACDTVCTS